MSLRKIIIACSCLLLLGLPAWAADGARETESKSEQGKLLFYEDMYGSRSGIQQFYDILRQLEKAMGDIPPDIERMALYNLRVDRASFSPGMAKFFQNKVEETFLKYGRRQIVEAPELKATRIVSTDTSFQMTNQLPTQEELWRVGEKLRLDAYIEGSLTRSEVGDVMLNLKVFKHKTAEVVWSGSFISGPNETKLSFPFMEFGLRLSLGYLPVTSYVGTQTLQGSALKLSLYQYGAEVTVGEAANSQRRLYLTAAGGLMVLVPVPGNARDSIVGDLSSYYTATAGADLLYVFVPKQDNDDGYWLGSYIGVRTYLPQKLITLRQGFTSRITRHFTIAGGFQFMPLLDELTSSKSLFGSSKYELKLGNPNYEISIQYAL